MYAHIYGNSKAGYELYISTSGNLSDTVKIEWHATNTSAKQSAKKQGAKAWNYVQ